MLSMDFMIYSSVLLMSCMVFSSGFFHVLKVLMALEFVIISSLMMLIFYSVMNDLLVMGIYYMIFAVCEAILGLSLVVLMVRYHGNEYTKSVMMMKW